MAHTIPTLRDLLRAAEERHETVPLLLAVTTLVEALNAGIAAQRRGYTYRRLSLDRIVLNGAPPEGLLADPTRDPKIEINAPMRPGTTIDLYPIGAIFFELLAGAQGPRLDALPRSDLPPAAEALLRDLLSPQPADPPRVRQALAAARSLGLDLLDAWDRKRRPSQLENDLRTALEQRHEANARELVVELSEIAPESAWIRRTELWLAVRSGHARREDETRRRLAQALYDDHRREIELWGAQLQRLLGPEQANDPDLELSRTWLREESEKQALRRQEARRTSLKLLLTGAPLIFATLLTGLLAAVMLFSG